MTPKASALRSGAGAIRKPLGQATRSLDAPAKVQKANASLTLPGAQNAIQVKAPKKKNKPSLGQSVSAMMLGGKHG